LNQVSEGSDIRKQKKISSSNQIHFFTNPSKMKGINFSLYFNKGKNRLQDVSEQVKHFCPNKNFNTSQWIF
jgi:hypothetical protein